MDRDEIIEALQAIIDGHVVAIEHNHIVVVNPDATPERIALAGVNPNLVIDLNKLITILQNG